MAIDTRRAHWARTTGIGRYVRELAAALQTTPGVEVHAISCTEQTFRDPLRKVAWEQVSLLPRSWREDLFHAPYYEHSPLAGRKLVVSVHDIDTVDAPHRYSSRVRVYNNNLLRVMLLRARRVLVPSIHTARRLESRFGVGDKVDVIPYGVSAAFFRAYPNPLVEPPYVLHTGGMAWRKNLPVLLEAFLLARQAGYAGKLVITGPEQRATLPPHLLQAVGNDLILPGVLSDDEVARLYSHADALLYPSALEGFGFPVLEAFAAGCPVVSAAAGSIAELADDAAVLVDHRDPKALSGALLDLMGNPGRRSALLALGARRAASFSWRRTAELTRASYALALA